MAPTKAFLHCYSLLIVQLWSQYGGLHEALGEDEEQERIRYSLVYFL